MKYLRRISTAVAMALAMAGATNLHAAGLQAGNTNPAPRRPSETATQSTPIDSREFVDKMAIAGLAEVELGKMAAERATNPDVKAFAQMMVRDHSRADQELSRVASQLNIQPPTQVDQEHRDLIDRLSKLQGAEFDREYMAAMVKGHQQVLEQLRSFTAGARPTGTAGGRNEQALRQWATKTLPTVQQHFDRARAIEAKLK
jgi:putative membrane protein